jgi:molecular chaperone DnaK
MSKIYGIDLGTTNSCIAVLRDGNPHVIPVDGSGIVPSVVSFDGKDILVGRKARNRAAAFPDQSIRSVKRLMGTMEKLKLGGKSYSPEDISAMILRYLCDEAKRLEGHAVERVVITVPAYFSDAQRRATMEAGSRADLRVERIINEPTAAALFYDQVNHTGSKINRHVGKDIHALVYDLGGGTFDVSILRMGDIVEVLASTGDTNLGGDDFDRRLVDDMIQHVKQKDDLNLKGVSAMARLAAIAEEAKLTLSEKACVLIEETHIPNPGDKNCHISMEFSREKLESMTEDLVDRTITLINKAIDEARLTSDRIDRVLLVGGMTRMPIISSKLEEIFGTARLPAVDPDLSVAYGAAIQGGIISGENCEQILVDVTPHTLSLATLADDDFDIIKCTPIIPRNTQIPVTRAKTFFTIYPRQEAAELKVYQGESIDTGENTLIGKTLLKLALADEKSPVMVEYSYDLNGVVHLVAEQKGYSRKTEIRIDSRNPQLYDSQALDDLEETEENGDDESKSEAPMNFVIQRARAIIEKMEECEKRATISELLQRYEKSLKDDDEEIDEIEDELLSAMEDV